MIFVFAAIWGILHAREWLTLDVGMAVCLRVERARRGFGS